MNMILRRLFQKEFTDIDIVREDGGELYRAVEHVLKLKYRFNYKNDREGHIGSIVGWVKKVQSRINKKKEKSKGPEELMRLLLESPKSKYKKATMIKDIQDHFSSDYEFKGNITEKDIDYAVDLVISCLKSKSQEEIKDLLEKEFKK